MYADKIVEILTPLQYYEANRNINVQIQNARLEVRKAYLAYIKKYPGNENLLERQVQHTEVEPRISGAELALQLGIAGVGVAGLYQIASWLLK